MEYELNEDGTQKLDAEGNPIPKVSSPPAPSPTIATPVQPAGIPPEVLSFMREQSANVERLQRELEASRQAPAPTAAEQNAEYYNNPATFFDTFAKKIAADVDAQIRPLNEYAQQTKKDSLINDAVATLSAIPQYTTQLSVPAIKNHFVTALRNMPQLTNELVMIALNNTIGLAYTGQIPGYDPTPKAAPIPAPVITPPHLSSSAPPANPKAGDDTVQLTEAEAKMARFYKMPPKEYKEAQESSSREYLAAKAK